ncbi:MAG: hypothetical protein ACHQET_13430 [Chitinophagales bacterium]
MDRRHFIHTAGLSIAAAILFRNSFAGDFPRKLLISFPDSVSAIINAKEVMLKTSDQQSWAYQNLILKLIKSGENTILVELQSPGAKLSQITLTWRTPVIQGAKILNDQWERTYGDASWHLPKSTEILPWYFMEHNNENTYGFGVKTGASSFCYWQIGESKLNLILDLRCGNSGVKLGERKLKAAEIVTIQNDPGESAFQTGRKFMKTMCEKARMPAAPVYGINDWYFSYGNTSEKLILEHTGIMAPLAGGLSNRPFSVIDAGWFKRGAASPDESSWGDVSAPNEHFGDMSSLAGKIRDMGMRPGIWTRPLCAPYKGFKSLMLPTIKGREENKPILDPSIPEVLDKVNGYFRLYHQWGYDLVKFDYTSFDIFGKWGFEMMTDKSMTSGDWAMHDKSKTNAEIILNLYKTIREAAGSMYLIGCNTISHLSAGLFELDRIGDDTSGREWARTKKMGVNTLAFRGIQHGAFYAVDADCVGLTKEVPWEKNRQWLDLVSKSGTPLFISAQPSAIGEIQKTAIKEAFSLASQSLPLGEPLDWMENATPKEWMLDGKYHLFNWD